MLIKDTVTAIPSHDKIKEEIDPFDIRQLRPNINARAEKEVPHRHNFHEIIWVKSGLGKHMLDSQRKDIEPQTFYLVAEGQVHLLIEGVQLEGYLIRFKDDFLPEFSIDLSWNYRTTLFNNMIQIHKLPVKDTDVSGFDTLLAQMLAEYKRNEFGKFAILRHQLSTLLIELERIRRTLSRENSATLDFRDTVFQNFLTLLDQQHKSFHTVDYYAENLNVTARQLSEISKHFVGRTAKQVIEARLILEAKRYLRYSNLSVKEVAYTLGFTTPSYFSRVFKKFTGVSPQMFQ